MTDKENVGDLRPPEFVQPHDIRSMNDTELDAMVAALQQRRLRLYEKYKVEEEAAAIIRGEKLRDRLQKKLDAISKRVTAIDAHLDKLEQTINAYRALKLQLED